VSATRFSRWSGGLRVGADFFERSLAPSPRADHPSRGLVDRMTDLAHPGIDVARVHPAIAVFFTDTAELDLLIRSRWRFPFGALWRLLRHAMRAIGQFVLPAREGRIATRVLDIDRARDGRADARAVIRTYAERGEVMQVVAYATFEAGGARYMSTAFPLPGGQIAGILRLDPIGRDDEGRLAVALTSRGGEAGIWYVIGAASIRLPLGEHLALWAAGSPCAPGDLDASALPGATLVGRHEQRVFGVRFVTHDYWFKPLDRGAPPRT